MEAAYDHLLLWLALAFLPTLIALARKHNSKLAIGMLNFLSVVLTLPLALFGGWIITMIAWFGALIWSLTGNTARRELAIRYPSDKILLPQPRRQRAGNQGRADRVSRMGSLR